ncbi:MAG: hypothetical protein D3910_20665, partial [Candidatus Electrothrix sp. ATG2]|nr:hypothetical protein [Candidatus Electrothrix sp. ATG2]
RIRAFALFFFLLTILPGTTVNAAEDSVSVDTVENTFTVAVLPIAVRGQGLENVGEDMQALLTAQLSGFPEFLLVERAEIDKALSEMELGISGTVNPETAAQIGQIVGAHILVTGRIFPVRKELALVGKMIGTETSRVMGVTAQMPLNGSVVEASVELADKMAEKLSTQGKTMVAERRQEEDLVAKLGPILKGKQLPSVSILIPEISMERSVPSPAAETEMGLILQQLGFELRDPAASNKAPDIEIIGEAFSEFGLRRGNLVSAKGRVEIRALDRSNGKVLAVDRATAVAVELSPEIAGKLALEKCGQQLVERLVKALAKNLPAEQALSPGEQKG